MKCEFALEHIGINGDSAEEAERLARLLCEMFHLEYREGKKSRFAGTYFECMREQFLGAKGHIAMRTPDLTAAVEEMKSRGYAFNNDTASFGEDGRLKNIYLSGEYGGFAIHILEK